MIRHWFKRYWSDVGRFIRMWIGLRSSHTRMIRQLRPVHVTRKQMDSLNRIAEAKSFVKNWLSKFLLLPLLLIVFVPVYFYITSPIASTSVSMRLVVSDIAFSPSAPVKLVDFDMGVSRKNVSHGYVSLNVNDGDGNNTQWTLIPNANSEVHLNKLVLPANAEIALSSKTAGEIIFTVSGDDGSKVEGELKVANTARLSMTDTKVDSLYIKDQTLKFQKTIGNEKFQLALGRLSNFGFPEMYVHSVLFEDRGPTGEFVDASIKEGTVWLLDTKNDSIVVHHRDNFKVDFDGNARVKISPTNFGLEVHIEGIATKLLIGAELMKNSPLFNRMPIRVEVSYQKYPYYWLIGITVLPLLITFFWPKRFKS